MVRIETLPAPEDVRQGARHTLYVEGNSAEAIDPLVLAELLADTKVTVRPLGPSLNIKSVAEALHAYHKDYYFLIDRDHHDDATVERSWANFPDQNTHNLLIWRRRELENYFIIPEYFMRSRFINCTEDVVRKSLLKSASRNIFRDAANITVIGIREQMKEKWIEQFSSIKGFETKANALAKINAVTEFSEKKKSVAEILRKKSINARFEDVLDELLAGTASPQFGIGKWFQRMRGKQLLPALVNECCTVRDALGKIIQGEKAVIEVAKDLLRLPLANQPSDFQSLHQLIVERIAAS